MGRSKAVGGGDRFRSGLLIGPSYRPEETARQSKAIRIDRGVIRRGLY